MANFKDIWDRLVVYQAVISNVQSSQEITVIRVKEGLEVDDIEPSTGIHMNHVFQNAEAIFYDVAYFRFVDTGYQKSASGEVLWDEPTAREITYRDKTQLDRVSYLGGSYLQTRNGNSWCDIEVWSRSMEVVAP
jgi:hypothetical protein